ncbi:MAG: sensor histidine kinase [Eubacteriaceae bacterium]
MKQQQNIARRLTQICGRYTNLTETEIRELVPIAESLPVIANLVEADVFIDCMTDLPETAVVAAEASPENVPSSYRGSVLGMYALAENEPAVLKSLMLSVPTRQMKAVTQENAEVLQSVEPIWHDGHSIGVLIIEKRLPPEALMLKSEALNELHHRVKNNLQTIASIISIQARSCGNPEAQSILEESISRIMAVSSAHELILNRSDDCVGLKDLAEDIGRNIMTVAARPDREFHLNVSGENMTVSSGTAGEVGMVLHEALMNSLKYAFEALPGGEINIEIRDAGGYPEIRVSDNGCGFDVPERAESGLGLSLMQKIVSDQLLGSFRIRSDQADGTEIRFTVRK